MPAAFALTILLVGGHAQSQQGPWPLSVSEAVHDLLSRLPADDKARLRQMNKDDLMKLHLGFGTDIRNRYGLWSGNNALIISACGQPCHPDDASMRIIEALWQELRK